MLGSAAAGQPDNKPDWGKLAEDAKQHHQSLDELAQSIGPDYDPGPDLITRLGYADDELRKLAVLVDYVRGRIGQSEGSSRDLAEPLEEFSATIRKARDVIDDCKEIVSYELEQRKADGARKLRYRSNKRRHQDWRMLRKVRRAAQKRLTQVCEHIDKLLSSLRG